MQCVVDVFLKFTCSWCLLTLVIWSRFKAIFWAIRTAKTVHFCLHRQSFLFSFFSGRRWLPHSCSVFFDAHLKISFGIWFNSYFVLPSRVLFIFEYRGQHLRYFLWSSTMFLFDLYCIYLTVCITLNFLSLRSICCCLTTTTNWSLCKGQVVRRFPLILVS